MRALQISVQLAEEAAHLSDLVLEASRIRSRAALQDWLLGTLQRWIPHHAVLVAWGDLRNGDICHDVIGLKSPGLGASPGERVRLFREAFTHWNHGGEQPLVLGGAAGRWGTDGATCALVHGLKDRLGRYDCLYLFVGPGGLDSARTRDIARILLPSIDTAFRQAVDTRPAAVVAHDDACEQDSFFFDDAADDAAPAPGASLSDRECEVMQWVRMGKTNSEIAMILNLSTFTVKNHMRRIFKKLNAGNRAQAVSLVGAQAPQPRSFT